MGNSRVLVDLSYYKPMNQKLLGNTIEWIDYANGLLKEDLTYNFNFINRLNQIPINCLRFPGNKYSNGYDWCNGVGGISKRSFSLSNISNTTDSQITYAGIDEFLNLCSLFKAEPIFTMNVRTDDVQKVLSVVNYVNEKINNCANCWIENDSVSENLPQCLYWEIGNNVYNDNSFYQNYMSYEDYFSVAYDLILGIKNINPYIKVGIPLALNNILPNENLDWTENILNLLSQTNLPIDYFTIQNLSLPYANNLSLSTNEIFKCLMTSSVYFENYISQIKDKIKNKIEKNIPIAINEYAPIVTQDTTYASTFMAALYNADLIMSLSKIDDILMANYSILNGSNDVSLISENYDIRPTYYVFQFLEKVLNGNAIKCKIDSTTFSNQNFGLINKTDAEIIKTIGSYKSIPGGIRVSYLLLNKDSQYVTPVSILYRNKYIDKNQRIGSIKYYEATEIYSSDLLSTEISPNKIFVNSINDPIKIDLKPNSLTLLRIDYDLLID